MLNRILSDLRDLWTLITKGQPEVDPLLPWRMVAELAKFQPAPFDIDLWEVEQYARNPLAVWFDPDRYTGTKYDWPKRAAPPVPDFIRYDNAQQLAALQSGSQAAALNAYSQPLNALSGYNAYGNKAGNSLASILGFAGLTTTGVDGR